MSRPPPDETALPAALPACVRVPGSVPVVLCAEHGGRYALANAARHLQERPERTR